MIAYIALFSALLSRLTALACGCTWVTSFIARFLNIHRSGVLTALAWLVLHETAAVSAQVLCIPYNHAPCHFMQSHICKVYACLAVTCHLHFWQNDRDLLRATAVTRGWNGYRNKSQYRKSTLEKKILPPLQQGFEPATFQSQVRHSNHWAVPALQVRVVLSCKHLTRSSPTHYGLTCWLKRIKIHKLESHRGTPLELDTVTWHSTVWAMLTVRWLGANWREWSRTFLKCTHRVEGYRKWVIISICAWSFHKASSL